MSAPGWTQTTGGTHFCDLHRGFVTATRDRPVWRYFATGSKSTACACRACAAKAVAA